MGNYSVQLKTSARKELEALPDNVLARVIQKIESLGSAPRPAGCKKLKGYKTSGAFELVSGEWSIPSTMR